MSCPRGVMDNASASGAGDLGSIPDGGKRLEENVSLSKRYSIRFYATIKYTKNRVWQMSTSASLKNYVRKKKNRNNWA